MATGKLRIATCQFPPDVQPCAERQHGPLRAVVPVLPASVFAAGCANEAASFHKEFGGPGPGDVYREYTYGRWFGQVSPDATSDGAKEMRARGQKRPRINIKDLDGAVRAEVSVQYWGGHIGTSDQKFRINGSDWFAIGQPVGTPTEPETYYRTVIGDNPVQVPLEALKEGYNQFEFTCGKQLRYNFNWAFYWIYSFTVRAYYDHGKDHVTGRVVDPVAGQRKANRSRSRPRRGKTRNKDRGGEV